MKPIVLRILALVLLVVTLVLAPTGGAAAQRQMGPRTPGATTPGRGPAPRTPARTPRATATHHPTAEREQEHRRLTATPRTPLVSPTVTAPGQSTPQPTGTPGALPETGLQPQPGGPLSASYDENLVRNLGQLASFCYESTVAWDLDNGRSGEAEVVTEATTRPSAQRWVLDIREAGRPATAYEVVRVAGQTYMNVAGEWREVMPTVQALVNRFAWIVDPQVYLDLSAGTFLGVEDVNGIAAERYRYATDAFDPAEGSFDLEGARVDLWIDRERDILARVHMLAVGDDPLGGSGAYVIDSTLVAVDQPLTIAAPTVASPEDLPPTGTSELILADALKLPQFDTYRLEGAVRWEMETGEQGSLVFDVAVDQQRPAERADVRVGQGGLQMSFVYLNIDGLAYIRSGDRWIAAEQFVLPALVEQLGWIGDPRGFVRQGEGRLVGREVVNGVQTEHYVFARQALGTLPLLTEVEEARVDAWYAPEHDAYVRLRAEIESTDSGGVGAEYVLESEVEVMDINAPITIERPTDFPTE
jgi:hypothetical protein